MKRQLENTLEVYSDVNAGGAVYCRRYTLKLINRCPEWYGYLSCVDICKDGLMKGGSDRELQQGFKVRERITDQYMARLALMYDDTVAVANFHAKGPSSVSRGKIGMKLQSIRDLYKRPRKKRV